MGPQLHVFAWAPPGSRQVLVTDWPVAALSSLPPSCWSTFPSLSTWCCSHCSRPRPSAPGLSWQEVGVWRRLPFSAVSFGPEGDDCHSANVGGGAPWSVGHSPRAGRLRTGQHSFSTTSTHLLLGAAPLRVRCFLMCRRERPEILGLDPAAGRAGALNLALRADSPASPSLSP